MYCKTGWKEGGEVMSTLAAEGLITSELAAESEVFAEAGPNETTSVFHIQLDADGAILTRRTAQ